MIDTNRANCRMQHLQSTTVIHLATTLLKRADQVLQQQCQISHAQLHILSFVECASPVSQKQLADSLDLTQAAISRITETMVKNQLLNRVVDPTNRRVNLLSLTERGEAKIAQAYTLIQELEAKLYTQMPASTLKSWQRTTDRLLKLVNPTTHAVQ